jgi:hypothetical protein
MSEINKEIIEDDALELVFTELKNLKIQIERNKALIELTQELVHELRQDIKALRDEK